MSEIENEIIALLADNQKWRKEAIENRCAKCAIDNIKSFLKIMDDCPADMDIKRALEFLKTLVKDV